MEPSVKSGFRWPTDNDRLAILGRTGTGKTQAGVHQLSMRSFDQMPWIVIDTKRDKLINQIEGAQDWPLSKIPTTPGLYIVRTGPRERDAIDDFLLRIWEQENTGVYVDEGYNVPQGDNWDGIATQGRSKRIPMIILSQRPAWMSRFTWSEADYFQTFWLNDLDDRKAVRRYVSYELDERLPPFWSHWYDVKQDRAWKMKPVPGEAAILATFRKRLIPDPQEPKPAEIVIDSQKRYSIL